MAAEAGESLAVATGAAGLFTFACVGIQVVRGVERGLQCFVVPMAGFATEGWIDLVVADEAIGHVGMMCLARGGGG